MKRSVGLLAAGVFTVFAAMTMTSLAVGEEASRKGDGEGREAIRKFRGEQGEARREHFKAQMEENKEFREGLKDEQPNKACLKILKHRRSQHRENVLFMDGQHRAFVEFVTNLMKEHGAGEKAQEWLAQTRERYQEMKRRHEQRHLEWMAKLQELSRKQDLTWEELKKAMEGLRPVGRGAAGPGKPAGPRGEGRQGVGEERGKVGGPRGEGRPGGEGPGEVREGRGGRRGRGGEGAPEGRRRGDRQAPSETPEEI